MKHVLYLVSHPIQYQVPLLRALSKLKTIKLDVLFLQADTAQSYQDPGFGCEIKWDIPLLEGYRYHVLSGYTDLMKQLLQREYDVLWMHGYSTPLSWFAIFLAKSKGANVLVRGESVRQFAHGSSIKRYMRPLFFKCLNRWVDGYLAIGTENRAFYKDKGVADYKLFLAPYTVDNAFFQKAIHQCQPNRAQLRASLGLISERPIILFASKFQARKRAEDLLHAYRLLCSRESLRPPPYLLFIGDGEMRTCLEKDARCDLPEDAVHFLGFKNQSELPAYFDLCDVFVLPSKQENWGLIINEVMNAARPVIVSDEVGCAPDLVQVGVNGMQYSAGDVSALADALQYVLSDAERIKQMGEKSLERINQWGIEQTAQGVVSACYEVCGSK